MEETLTRVALKRYVHGEDGKKTEEARKRLWHVHLEPPRHARDDLKGCGEKKGFNGRRASRRSRHNAGGTNLVRAPENFERPAVQREKGFHKPRVTNCAGSGDPPPMKSQREKRGNHQHTPRDKREGARFLAGRARTVHRGVRVLVEAGTAQGAKGAGCAEKAAFVTGGSVLN